MKEAKIVLYGIGWIGSRMAEALLEKKGMKIVGAVDIDPSKIGKDLGEYLGKKRLGVTISNDADKVLSSSKPDIVVHTTSSYLKDTFTQFSKILEHGVNVVSTCEELSYPYVTEEQKMLAEKLDKLAKEKGATVPQIALAFIMQNGLNVFPLTGSRTSAEFADSAESLDVKLTAQERAWLDLESDER